jgi:hypothetical protein
MHLRTTHIEHLTVRQYTRVIQLRLRFVSTALKTTTHKFFHFPLSVLTHPIYPTPFLMGALPVQDFHLAVISRDSTTSLAML